MEVALVEGVSQEIFPYTSKRSIFFAGMYNKLSYSYNIKQERNYFLGKISNEKDRKRLKKLVIAPKVE